VREGKRREAALIQEESAAARPKSTDGRYDIGSHLPNPNNERPREPAGQEAKTSPQPSPNTRLFGFRLRSSEQKAPILEHTSSLQTPPTTSAALVKADAAAHLTSSSMPSLVLPVEASEPSKRESELELELETEKKRHRDTISEKANLESELESLSQALFEEVSRFAAARAHQPI